MHVGPLESTMKSWQARFLPKQARDQGYHQALRDSDEEWRVRYNSNFRRPSGVPSWRSAEGTCTVG
jgi:hypothetical protein